MVRKLDSKFATFVLGFGVKNLSRRLGVERTAVYHWLRGSNSPHPANALKIQRLARSRHVELSLDDIYQHFREAGNDRYSASSLKPHPARA